MCQDDIKSESSERKSKKRKSDSDVWPGQKKGKPGGIAEMMDSDSDSESDAYVNDDDNTNNSNSTNDDGRESLASQNEFVSDLELSGMDATDARSQDNRTSSDMDNSNDADLEDNMMRLVFFV